MFKVNKFVKPVVISMLVLPTCQVAAASHFVQADVNESSVDAQRQESMQLAAAQPARTKPASSDAVVESLLNKARYWKQQGRLDLASNTWERVLRSNPMQEEALAGLAVYHASMGHGARAGEYLEKLKQVNPKNSVVEAVTRALYSSTESDAAAAAVERAKASLARASAPTTPWTVLDQARALRKQGEVDAANKKIDHMTAARLRDRDTNYAGAIYYAEGGQWTRTLALMDKIAERDRGELISGLRSRAVVYVRTEQAKKQFADGAETDAVQTLTSAENDAKGNPELLALMAHTWSGIGHTEMAAALLERNKPLTTGLQLQLADALLQTKQHEKLGQLLVEIDGSGEELGESGALDRIRIAHALHVAEGAKLYGKFAEGLSALRPLLEKYPQNISLLLAQAGLQGGAGDLPDALKSVDAVLAIESDNHEAIRQGAIYAIQSNDYLLAEKYLAASKIDDADRAGLYFEAGEAARENKNEPKAAEYFAVSQRIKDGKGVVDIATSPERQLSGSESRQEAYVEGAYSMRYKTGLVGVGYLYEKEIPVSWHIPIEEGRSSVIVKAAQVEIDAGDLGLGLWMDLFGTNAAPAVAPPAASFPVGARGTAVSVGYQSTALSADIGISPMGFQVNNIVGGVRWNTDISGSNISLEASRRSVTDSVLSYAGLADNNQRPGQVWGGVVKTGGQVGLYYPFEGDWAGYASAGLYSYSGTNVANNSSANANATLIYQLARTEQYVATLAARVAAVSFDNNQKWFFWGHGGYYSPQSDQSFSVPFSLHGKSELMAYEFNFTPSVSNVTEAAAPTYPTDPVLQAATPALRVATVRNGNASWKMDWTVEYEFAPQFVVGNRSHYEESQTYQQLGTMFYLRYDMDDRRQNRIPPNPIRPYYITTEGGAGLN